MVGFLNLGFEVCGWPKPILGAKAPALVLVSYIGPGEHDASKILHFLSVPNLQQGTLLIFVRIL